MSGEDEHQHARRHDDHGHHHHVHHAAHGSGATLLWALILTLAFAAVEAAAGFWSGSLALLSDAGHMLTDSASLALATVAVWLAKRPPSRRHTYGLGRVETLAALANVLLMVAVVVSIAVVAVRRYFDPVAVDGPTVTVVALVGLALNVAVAWLLLRGEQTMNTRGALLHVLGDLAGSIAALIAGAVIIYTGWTPIDALLSLLICALVLASSLRLLREVLQALLEGVPAHLSIQAIGEALAGVDGVRSVHDLHVWTLSSNRIALSAHLVVDSFAEWPSVLAGARHVLHGYGIAHSTLQPESAVQVVRWQDAARAREESGEGA